MNINKSSKLNVNLSLDWRIVAAVLGLIIVAMLALWRPWSATGASDRIVEVTGEASLKATPDEFVFYPTYQIDGTDKQKVLDELTKKTDEIVKGLKDVGVPSSGIKTSSAGYDYKIPESSGQTTYSTQLTVSVDNKELAQKVQNYLVNTGAEGSISPQYGYSDKKQNELESKARNLATKDARAKADQMGKNLGFKVGKIKAVNDGAGFGSGPIPYDARTTMEIAPAQKDSSLKINPGENELSYSVTVVYFIR